MGSHRRVKFITVQLTEAEHDAIAWLAEENGEKKSAFLRRLGLAEVNKYKPRKGKK